LRLKTRLHMVKYSL